MKVPRDICAFDRTNRIKSTRRVHQNVGERANNRREILIIENSPGHPCFVKLWSSKRHRYFKKPSTNKLKVDIYDTPNGPSFRRNLFRDLEKWFSCIFEQFGFSNQFRKLMHASKDEVFAIECPSWPIASKEWICRKRENNWPSKKCVEQVVEGGCHVVAKPHDSNIGDDTEWRFSFSKAEIVLIHTWTAKQSMCITSFGSSKVNWSTSWPAIPVKFYRPTS